MLGKLGDSGVGTQYTPQSVSSTRTSSGQPYATFGQKPQPIVPHTPGYGDAVPRVPTANLMPQSQVRAMGSGPFDARYRQNLATYSAGLLAPSGNTIGINPTANNPWASITGAGMPQTAGAGSSPVLSTPLTQLAMALGQYGSPANPALASAVAPIPIGSLGSPATVFPPTGGMPIFQTGYGSYGKMPVF